MHYEQLLMLVTLAAFAASSTAGAVCTVLSWCRFRGALNELRPVVRARVLLLWRAVPAIAAAFVCAVTILAFRRHEPASTVETPGWILLAGACVGACLISSGIWRVVASCSSTRRFLQAVESSATRVTIPGVQLPAWQLDTAFPLVALAGIWRPRLLLARRVLEELPQDELQIVVRHEVAHARRRDNVARLLLAVMPDMLPLAERRLGIARAWDEAAEDAADDLATGDDPQAQVRLASALVRVARMASGHAAPCVPLLAFHRGGSMERRVRRLVDSPAPPRAIPSLPAGLLGTAVALGLLALWRTLDPALLAVHGAIEWLVNARL